ncbi:phosphatidylinositol-3-phosphatase myotubularin-1-like [Olea europaea var. sylvestris]|uniref:phosphatidylinositol-3-phosphatase myotubularin-1-like n=1 Tax=Olea europaea var. sylvestris TaxID=158386 RepID=UPI000C1CF063|nr:phosphatidylinositol-3-phosphatase myotubularin-1-like [Olea europaea var. sylvestris]
MDIPRSRSMRSTSLRDTDSRLTESERIEGAGSWDAIEWTKIDPVSRSVPQGLQHFLLEAEEVIVEGYGVVLVNTDEAGTLFVTNFRLLFLSDGSRHIIGLGTIPLATIEKFNKVLGVQRTIYSWKLKLGAVYFGMEGCDLWAKFSHILFLEWEKKERINCRCELNTMLITSLFVFIVSRIKRRMPNYLGKGNLVTSLHFRHYTVHGLVMKLPSGPRQIDKTPSQRLLQVIGKDMRIIVFGFRSRTKQRRAVYDALLRCTRPARLWDLYAFACGPSRFGNTNPKERLLNEYFRLLGLKSPQASARTIEDGSSVVSNECWRISNVNSNYTMCPTYPFALLVPKSISDIEIQQACTFRARCRLPVITWCDPGTRAVLARSSQPLVGLMMNMRSNADEKLVAALLTQLIGTKEQKRKLYIADARPRKNALANGAMGGGSESSANYFQSEIVFFGIDNIHAMRDSLSRLRDYVDTHGATSSDGMSSFLRHGGWTWGGGNLSSMSASVSTLGDSGWLIHVQSVLAGSSWIAARVALESATVLVHCSDGWDRTTQLVSLASLLLDPYYRTIIGFQVRINFIDIFCLTIRVTRLFGPINLSEKERQQAGISDSCGCLWMYLADLRASEGSSHVHYNLFYDPTKHEGPLLPPAAALAPTVWPQFHLRWTCPSEAQAGEVEAICRNMAKKISELQKAKEVAEAKAKETTSTMESLTVELRNEKLSSSSAWNLTKRARKEIAAIKRAMQSLGCKIHFSEDSECVGIENNAAGIPQKSIYSASDEESSGYFQHDNKSDMSVFDTVLADDPINPITRVCESICPLRTRDGGCRWPDAECARFGSEFVGLKANFNALDRLSIYDSYFQPE